MSETTQTAMYYNGNWYGRSGNTDALDARITQTANNIAPRQISDTASKLIAVGEYFTDKLGRLCVCDVQIASGGSIVVGSNCHVVSEGIGNELNDKFTDIFVYFSLDNPVSIVGQVKTGVFTANSLTTQYQPISIIGSTTGQMYQGYAVNGEGLVRAGENIPAGAYALMGRLFLK